MTSTSNCARSTISTPATLPLPTGAFPAPFEVLQREVYVTLLIVQDVTLLVALVILIGTTRGRLGYDAAPQSDLEDIQFQPETDEK